MITHMFVLMLCVSDASCITVPTYAYTKEQCHAIGKDFLNGYGNWGSKGYYCIPDSRRK